MPKKKKFERRTYRRQSDSILKEMRDDIKTLIQNNGEMTGKLDSFTGQCDNKHNLLKAQIKSGEQKGTWDTFKDVIKRPIVWIQIILYAFLIGMASASSSSANQANAKVEKMEQETTNSTAQVNQKLEMVLKLLDRVIDK